LALAAGAQPQAAVSEGLAAMKASARQPKRCAGGGDQAAAWRQARHGVHQDSSSLEAGAQQHRNFFLDSNDRFGALQPKLQAEVVSPRSASPPPAGFGSGGFGAALGGAQRFEGACGALTPPVRQR